MKLIALIIFLTAKTSFAWKLEVLTADDKVIKSVPAKNKKVRLKPFSETLCEAIETTEIELTCKDVNGSSSTSADCSDGTNANSIPLSINNPLKIEETRVVRVNCKEPGSTPAVKTDAKVPPKPEVPPVKK